jgi:hypothetical protein
MGVPIWGKKRKLKVKTAESVQYVHVEATHEKFGDFEAYLVNFAGASSNEEAASLGIGPDGVNASASEKRTVQNSGWKAIIQGDNLPLTFMNIDDLDLSQLRADLATTASESTGGDVSSSDVGRLFLYPKGSSVVLDEVKRADNDVRGTGSEIIIMAKCEECGKTYSTGIVINSSSDVRLQGNIAQCPYCGRMNPVPDR